MITIPETAVAFGFLNQPNRPAIDRTILLPELTLLLAACPPDAAVAAYRDAVIEDNVLLKASALTRRDTFKYLQARYLLDRRIVLFRALRDLWADDATAHQQVALLAALARDPLLRATAPVILGLSLGATLVKDDLVDALAVGFPGRYQPATLREIAQRIGTSWMQAGLLTGRATKTRIQSESRLTGVAYALLLGYLCGERGEGLFATFWTKVLAAPIHVVREQAAVAARHGWIEYRAAGNVTEVGFRHLLRDGREAA